MAKNKKIKLKIKKQKLTDPSVEEILEKEIEYVCPVRGKVVEKVKVKKLKCKLRETKQAVSAKDDPNHMDPDDALIYGSTSEDGDE